MWKREKDWIDVPKVPFAFLINWKRKVKIAYLGFGLSENEKQNPHDWLPFSSLIKNGYFNTCAFNALILFFIFMKNGKRNTVRSVSWRNLKTSFSKRSRLTPWLFSREWSTHYSRPSSCLSSLLRFDAVQWSRGY